MKLTVLIAIPVLMVLGASTACAQGAPTAAPAATGPQTEDQKTLYAMGLAMGASLDTFHLSADELVQLQAGLTDSVLKQPAKVDLQTYKPMIRTFAETRAKAAAAEATKAGDAYVAKAAGEAGAVKTPSGMVYHETQAGTGASPVAADRVRVHYKGTLLDGSVFDSSLDRGTPAEFQLANVIPCWTEGLQKMKVGGKAKLVCPAPLAYGDRGAPPAIPPGSTLLFDVELLDIVK